MTWLLTHKKRSGEDLRWIIYQFGGKSIVSKNIAKHPVCPGFLCFLWDILQPGHWLSLGFFPALYHLVGYWGHPGKRSAFVASWLSYIFEFSQEFNPLFIWFTWGFYIANYATCKWKQPFAHLSQCLFLLFLVFMEDNVGSGFWQLPCMQLGKFLFLVGFCVCCYKTKHGYFILSDMLKRSCCYDRIAQMYYFGFSLVLWIYSPDFEHVWLCLCDKSLGIRFWDTDSGRLLFTWLWPGSKRHPSCVPTSVLMSLLLIACQSLRDGGACSSHWHRKHSRAFLCILRVRSLWAWSTCSFHVPPISSVP